MAIRVLTIDRGGSEAGYAVTGYDLTDDIEGLSFSNVEPGGDEQADFIYRRPWSNDLPEIAKGNLLIIEDGLDVLWQGRIGEPARGGGDSESVAVTGYGLGVRLKDGLLQQTYVDKDLNQWGPPSASRQIVQLETAKDVYADKGGSVAADTASGDPTLFLSMDRLSNPTGDMRAESLYRSLVPISDFYYEVSNSNAGTANGMTAANAWIVRAFLSTDDLGSVTDVTGNTVDSHPTSGTLSATGERYHIGIELLYQGTVVSDGEFRALWRNLAVYGNHGLTPRSAGGGFYASDVIPDVIDDVDGVELRTNDATTLEIKQLISDDTHEALITKMHELHRHEHTWGTWGPDDVLAERDAGYFDWTARPSRAEWFTLREACEDLDLSSEIDNLFDTVIVTYADTAGNPRQVTRTLPSAELDAAGMSGKTARLSGGRMATEIAEAFGDAVLTYMGGYAPARGSFTIAQPIKHATRGYLPPHYLRADGAMVRIPDILPATTLFALDDTPDRRTTFPIKRVRVDLSGTYPKATVDIDQSNDLISTTEARLDLAAQTTLG